MNTKKIIEMFFWLLALAVVLFINISPQALRSTNPAYMIVFLTALLVIVSANIMPKIKGAGMKFLFSAVICAAVFLSVHLFFTGKINILIYYYLPVLIAFAMAFIVVVKPAGSVTVFVALCTFLLGEAFWNINIGKGSRLIFPTAFLSIYSLSIIALFGYYLYSREVAVRREMTMLNERLKALDSMKSEFVANVSHELRTPLTSIKNACVLLKKGENRGEKVELLEIVDSNVDRQARLINNLLDLAKIEKGAVAQRILIDMGVVAKQVVDSMALQAKEKSINLELIVEPGLPKAYASFDQMLEAYTNIIDNAIKYSHKNSVVSVKISKDKNGIKSVISDMGIGIKKEDIGKLFDRFKRLEAILENRPVRGTGLGLAIVKEIIDSHNGKVWIESSPGKGASVIFTMPLGLRKGD